MTCLAVAAATGTAGARPATSDHPAVLDAWIDGDAVTARVRLAGGAAPTAADLMISADGAAPIATDRVGIAPCGERARVAVLVAYGAGAGPGGAAPADSDSIATAVETALGGLHPDVSLAVIDGSGADLPPAQPLDAALARLAPPVGPATRAGLELAFKGVEPALGGGRGRRRLVVMVAVGDVDTAGLERIAPQLVERGVELYEIRLGGVGLASRDPLRAYAVVAQPGSAREQGDSVGAEIDRCHLVTVPAGALPSGAVALAVGLDRQPDANPRRSVVVPARAGESGGTARWVWILVGVGVVVVVVGLVVVIGGRAPQPGGGTLIYTPLLDGGDAPEQAGVAIGVKTRRLDEVGGVGKTRPIDPIAAERLQGTVAQAPAPGLAAWLVVYRHGVPTDTLVLQTVGVTTVGRDPEMAIRLDDDTVSKRHARITARAGHFQLEDLGSKHGTVVDGKAITGPVELRDGMRVRFGYTRVRFKCTR